MEGVWAGARGPGAGWGSGRAGAARHDEEERKVDLLEHVDQVLRVAVGEEGDSGQDAALQHQEGHQREETEHRQLRPDPLDDQGVLGQLLLEILAYLLEDDRQSDERQQDDQDPLHVIPGLGRVVPAVAAMLSAVLRRSAVLLRCCAVLCSGA